MYLYRQLNMESFGHKILFCHNLTEATKQKTDWTKAVNEHALMMEIRCRPINMESFSHKMFISSQPY